MALEVGSIVEGKVTGITKFGAFVELPGGKTGMVHISEVAATYVKEIKDFISDSQIVRVKILAITPDGKINLSNKRAVEQPPHAAPAPRRIGPGSDRDWSAKTGPQSFEEMLSKFKQTSDSKISDLKRNIDGKRGSSGKKSHSK